jgi:outer membrane protein
MTSRSLACLIALLLPAATAAQQTATAASLSLDAAVDAAAANNRQLQAARLNVERADTDAAIARSRRLPVFQAEASASQLLSQTQSALDARNEAIALYRELDRTLAVRVAQKVALRGDALDVQFRLAQEELGSTTTRNALSTQKEQLSQLLGRDVRTAFEVEPAAAVSLFDVDVDAAQRRALAARPDAIQARLTLERAELDRRIARAERLPDVSLAPSLVSNVNVDVLPRRMAAAGVKVTWEPFDWGRRRQEVAAKGHAVVQARLAVREAEDKAVIEVNSRFRTLAEKRALLQVAQLAQVTARENLRVRTNQYRIEACWCRSSMPCSCSI